jgi:hypothetical protein
MHRLINLPGVAGGCIERVQFFHSVTEAMELLRTDRACTGSGDNGATTVWRGDAGEWHCAFHRRLVELDHTVVKHKKDVLTWLKVWFPQIVQ